MIFEKAGAIKDSLEETTDARNLLLAQLANTIFSRGHAHTATATSITFVPDGNPATPLVALAGRGQVGKTALLRSLFRSPREVGRSNRVLRRDSMNFFNVGDVFNIVDLPGFGGTSVPWSTVLQHAVLLRNFTRCQPSLKMLYYCMDVHFKNGVYIQDIDILKFLSKEVPNFTIVLTKADSIGDTKNPSGFRLEDIRKELLYNDIHHPVIVTSAYKMGGIDTLRYDMVMNCLHALPTERLTLTEARKLSERLFSQKELQTVRQLYIPPTKTDYEVQEWNKEVAEEYKELGEEEEEGEDGMELEAATPPGSSEFDVNEKEVEETAQSGVKELALVEDGEELQNAIQHFNGDENKITAYKSLLKKVKNEGLMRYVQETSPWRNPLLWPKHVVPTKHPKSNIMRCPEDPTNPYLSQAQFVVPRADFYFRRPNVGVRRSSRKGQYEADKPLQMLLKQYTIPYFPDIVDTNMHPLPWTFLGSREAYYEKSGGRMLGVRLSHQSREGEINPLLDNPTPSQPQLTNEIKRLEEKRYGSSITMLQPPGMEEEEETEMEGNTASAPSLPN
ncbi:hypothetical protein AGDE_06496 [Angomonas deanei]|uniref:50S ribosome-binding GTPase, putative n=1 Tax=Angomonas deanei TaxID=59799 RepID=A0A7G2CAH2_9TRYP|nr:hypothetical protein AGDE_06496 [Angomonas deanei]CAD2216758.1 50S ribosome-binding GTPase, putative [Angomonas deanei]|eukprot:EPY37438.1 hypothetical protein AGDE_06496 [Angomonas deanei]